MKLPTGVRNPGLAALLRGCGIATMSAFAEQVNEIGRSRYGLALTYDHTSVKRWLRGAECHHPELVAEVLTRGWGIPVSPMMIWPAARDGGPPISATLVPWVAARTIEELDQFLRSDLMIDRRELLNDAFAVSTGAALIDPIRRWLAVDPLVGFTAESTSSPGQIGVAEVADLESASSFLRAHCQAHGGALRDAAVGQLKHVTQIARHGRYTEEIGWRLLATTAHLGSVVGWMSHELDLRGPAQRYFIFSLQAAREAGDNLLVAEILYMMANQMNAIGHPREGLDLVEMALCTAGDQASSSMQARLFSTKGRMLASMGRVSDCRRALGIAEHLSNHPDDDAPPVRLMYPGIKAELTAEAGSCYRDLIRHDKSLGNQAQSSFQRSLELRQRSPEHRVGHLFGLLGLGRTYLFTGEPERACSLAQQAAELNTGVVSNRVTGRFRDFVRDSQPYATLPAVRDLHEKLRPMLVA